MERNVMLESDVLKKAIWGRRNEVADMLGIDPTSLSRKIHRQQTMSVDELVRIAYYLNIDIRKFIKLPE